MASPRFAKPTFLREAQRNVKTTTCTTTLDSCFFPFCHGYEKHAEAAREGSRGADGVRAVDEPRAGCLDALVKESGGVAGWSAQQLQHRQQGAYSQHEVPRAGGGGAVRVLQGRLQAAHQAQAVLQRGQGG